MTRTEILNMPIERWPLSFVPSPEQRKINSGEMHVAGHELNHALVALSLGIPVVSLSVVPEGNSLGRTILAGTLSAESLKIVAAAGSIPTHDGQAMGYGSDLSKVNLLSYFYGGESVEGARSRASGIILNYPLEIREKAAEIIAFLKVVDGNSLRAVMKRAQLELEYEKNGYINEDFENFEEEKQEIPQDFTIIEDLKGGRQRITHVVDGLIKKEEFVCRVCRGIGQHEKECPLVKDKKPFAEGSSGTIFSKQELLKRSPYMKNVRISKLDLSL